MRFWDWNVISYQIYFYEINLKIISIKTFLYTERRPWIKFSFQKFDWVFNWKLQKHFLCSVMRGAVAEDECINFSLDQKLRLQWCRDCLIIYQRWLYTSRQRFKRNEKKSSLEHHFKRKAAIIVEMSFPFQHLLAEAKGGYKTRKMEYNFKWVFNWNIPSHRARNKATEEARKRITKRRKEWKISVNLLVVSQFRFLFRHFEISQLKSNLQQAKLEGETFVEKSLNLMWKFPPGI